MQKKLKKCSLLTILKIIELPNGKLSEVLNIV